MATAHGSHVIDSVNRSSRLSRTSVHLLVLQMTRLKQPVEEQQNFYFSSSTIEHRAESLWRIGGTRRHGSGRNDAGLTLAPPTARLSEETGDGGVHRPFDSRAGSREPQTEGGRVDTTSRLLDEVSTEVEQRGRGLSPRALIPPTEAPDRATAGATDSSIYMLSL